MTTSIIQYEKHVVSGGSEYYIRTTNDFILIAGWMDTWWCGQLIKIIGEIDTNRFFNEFEENHSVCDAVYGIYKSKLPELYDEIEKLILNPNKNERMYKSCMFCCCRHGDINIGPDGTEYPKFISDDYKTNVSELWTIENVFKRLENVAQKMESQELKNAIKLVEDS
jgi:hypothetical protein